MISRLKLCKQDVKNCLNAVRNNTFFFKCSRCKNYFRCLKYYQPLIFIVMRLSQIKSVRSKNSRWSEPMERNHQSSIKNLYLFTGDSAALSTPARTRNEKFLSARFINSKPKVTCPGGRLIALDMADQKAISFNERASEKTARSNLPLRVKTIW